MTPEDEAIVKQLFRDRIERIWDTQFHGPKMHYTEYDKLSDMRMSLEESYQRIFGEEYR